MNKLLQHIMNAGGGTDKFLPFLEQFQTKGEYKGKSPLLELASRQGPVYDNIPNPAIYRAKAEMDMKAKQQAAVNAMRERQGEIRSAGPKRSAISKTMAIAAHPMTAASYVVKGQRIPDNFEKGSINNYDLATSILNPASVAYSALEIPSNINDADYTSALFNTMGALPFFGMAPAAIKKVNPALHNVNKQLIANKQFGRLAAVNLLSAADAAGPMMMKTPGLKDLYKKAAYNVASTSGGSQSIEPLEAVKRALFPGLGKKNKYVGSVRNNLDDRDLVRQYIYGDAPGFETIDIQPYGLEKYFDKYGDIKVFKMNSKTPHGVPISVEEDSPFANSFKDAMRKSGGNDAASQRGYVTVSVNQSGNPVLPIDDVAGHTVRVSKTSEPGRYKLTSQDIWKFYPEDYLERWGSGAPRGATVRPDDYITYLQAKLLERAGNPFILMQENPLQWIDPIPKKTDFNFKDPTYFYKKYTADDLNEIANLDEQALYDNLNNFELYNKPERVTNLLKDKFLKSERFKKEGGEADEPKQYTGSSIVDYLATKGYSGKKAFRKGLAEEYGVEDYDFSAKKNLELLARMRENDELLRAKKEDFAPIPVERIEQMYAERAAQQPSVQPIVNAVQVQKKAEEQKRLNDLRRRMTLELGFDPFVEGPRVKKIETPKLSLSSKNPYGVFNLFTGFGNQGSTKQQPAAPVQNKPAPAPVVQQSAPAPAVAKTAPFRFDLDPVPKPGNASSFIQFPPYPTKQMAQLPKGRTAQVAAKQLEKEEDNRAWYEKLWDSYSEAVNNSPLDFSGINLGGAGFSPQGAKIMTRDLTKGVLSIVSEDLAEKYKNKMERQDAKLNPNERKSILDPSKVKFDPVYVTGDTIPDTKRRYHIPEVIDLDYMRFGVRNRGDMREIQTEGAPITTFEPFQSSKQYFAKTKDPANATYVGVAPDGRIKVGGRDQFQDQDYQVTRTYGNKIVDFNRDAKGSIVKVPSNPKASKETLSPSVKVLGDDGKVVDGKLSLLLPRTGNQEESFDLVTGGRYILQTPDGKTKLVSGSLKNIEGEFYKMKKNHPWVNVITLDNGSYARGIRTFDQKLTKQDLKGYDNQNTGGGNFAYILPGERKTRYESKFTDFEAEAKRRLQSMYPGKKVSIGFQNEGLYDQTGGRDIESQVAIQKRGNSQTPVSLHNFGAAKDYILYVDGQAIDPEKYKKLYKDVLWGAADKTGLYHLEDWDPAHISLAKEGQKTAFDELYAKYPDIFAHPNFIRSLNYVNKNKTNPLYEEYYELLNNLQPFTGKPRTTEVMKRTMAKKDQGGPVVSKYGQWAYPGMDTIVPSGDITMKGVPYPVYGQDETGYAQMMYPGGEYTFPGNFVYEVPMMSKGGQHGGLDRWFAEKWVDVKTGKACGRQEGENRSYPACRPSKRISSKTPKTSSEMSPSEKAKFKRTKTSSERIPYNHKRN